MKILLFDDTINQWSISRVLMTSLFGIRFERMSRVSQDFGKILLR